MTDSASRSIKPFMQFSWLLSLPIIPICQMNAEYPVEFSKFPQLGKSQNGRILSIWVTLEKTTLCTQQDYNINKKWTFTMLSHWHVGWFVVSASVTDSYSSTWLSRPYGEAWMSTYTQHRLTLSHFCWDCFKIIFSGLIATNLYGTKRGLCLEISVPMG